MAHTLIVENNRRIKKAVPLIEARVKIKINCSKGSVFIEGPEYHEYIVEKILKAVDFGFDVEDALMLLNDNFTIEFINVKEHTHRKNLTDIRARLIGTDGRAKRTIEELTGGAVVLNANTIGIIVDSEHLSQTVQGIKSIIQGAKHGNVFSYLEKQNAELRHIDEEDLGLKIPIKENKDEE